MLDLFVLVLQLDRKYSHSMLNSIVDVIWKMVYNSQRFDIAVYILSGNFESFFCEFIRNKVLNIKFHTHIVMYILKMHQNVSIFHMRIFTRNVKLSLLKMMNERERDIYEFGQTAQQWRY